MGIKNDSSDLVLDNSLVFQLFENFQGGKKLFLGKGINKYAALICSSKIDISLESIISGGILELFFVSPIYDSTPLSINLNINLLHSEVKIDVNLIALVKKDVPTFLNAEIFMDQGIQNSSANLLEESIILSKAVSIKNLPVLDIRAKNIHASHGAKIYHLNGDNLFYLESRGITYSQAQKILLSSFSERLFDRINITEEEKFGYCKNFFYS